jgi:hypothetical protein
MKGRDTTNNRLRAMDGGALAALGSFVFTDWKSRMMVIHLDPLSSYEGTAFDERP